jgi:FixJ family two-component response regulator
MPNEDIVFVVDDDAAIRDALKIAIRQAGYEVETFGSAEAFLAAYRPGTPGCVILDVRMGGMNGFGLQALLPAKGIDLPVIFLTAHGNVPGAVRAMERGAVTFLEKPARHDVLLHHVENALAQYHRRLGEDTARRIAAEKLASLTPREREVAELLAKGQSNKEMARRLGVSPRTIEAHRARIRNKTGAQSEAELTRLMLEANPD